MSETTTTLEPGFRRSMLLVSMLFVAVMAALDLTIVAVALPYMAGGLSATPDEITWVVTLFSIGQAIIIGVTGHLSRLLGRKRLAVVAVVGFVTSSVACGLAQDLDMIVLFRFIQGLFSGPLIPISQAVLIDAYPAEQRTRVVALWAMGVTAGPAAGPALGGLLTQTFDWRWNFWVNLPIGIVALLLVLTFMRPVKAQSVRTDWLGLALLATFLICLQVGLDQGDRLDWFASHEIVTLLTVAFAGFVVFSVRGVLVGERNIVNLHLLGDGNFAACALLMGITGINFLAFLVLAPAMYVDWLGWEIVTAGYAIGLSAAALIVASQIANPLRRLVGTRMAVLTGSAVTSIGWYLFSRINLGVSPLQVMLPGALICGGLMIIFPVIAAQAFANIPARLRDEAAGLFNLVKTIGFAFGVTFVSTLVYRGTQENWSRIAGFLDPTRAGYAYFVQASGYDDRSPDLGALAFRLIEAQSAILTYIHSMEVLASIGLASIPLVVFMRTKAKAPVVSEPTDLEPAHAHSA